METKVFCKNDGSFYSIPKGSTLSQVYDLLPQKLPYPCVGAKSNAKTVSLSYDVFTPQDVTFLDYTSAAGKRIYVRSLFFLLCSATLDVLPKTSVRIEHSYSHNYFITLSGHSSVSADIAAKICARMREMVAQALPFVQYTEHSSEVARIFRERGCEDKARLIETSGKLYTTYYSLNNYIDFYYSALVSSTAELTLFDLKPCAHGLILIVPSRSNPLQLEPVKEQPKLLSVITESARFNAIAHLNNVGNLNLAIQQGQVGDLIRLDEAMQEKRLAAIAEEIASRPKVKVVLLAGPSSSGKTSTSKRLSVQLMTCLKKPVALSMDNWFVDRDKTPVDEFGEKDFESIYSMDLEQFNRDLTDLIEGREIKLPTYNFQSGQREYRGETLRLEPDTLLVCEGIHALNPLLTQQIAAENKFLIYASALTTISLDDHNCIPTTDNRLLRRIIRDYQTRGCSAADTIGRWESVRRGEEKWIFPFQENADAIFNTAMIYELPAIKVKAEMVLREVPHDAPEINEAQRLLRFLEYFKPIYDNEIPYNSLLREFIGGSVFDVG